MSEIYLNLSTSNDNVEPLAEARLHLGGMRRLNLTRALVAVALATASTACDDPGPTAPTPETPVVENVTETYSGILARNGAVTFPFAVSAGTATATLTGLLPDNTVAIGLSMGTWNGTACAAVISNDNATEFTQLTGTAGQAGTLCLRIHDVGRLTAPATFTVAVVHP
jgi:hypothetical protein